MKKFFFSLLAAFVSASGVFAATEQSWYNDIASCTAGMQVYIYTPNGKGFVQENAAKCFNATTTSAPAMWTISKQDDGTIKSTNGYYLRAYQTASNTTSKSTADGSEKVCVTSMKSGAYWNIHGHYKYLAVTYYAALYYKDDKYDATCNMLGKKATHEESEYQFYFISADQYTRHWVIYEFDSYKESFSPANYNGKIPSAMVSALSKAYNVNLDIKSNTTAECQTALSNLKQLKTDADNAISVYAAVWVKINDLDAITDRGEDPTVVNNAISSAKTNIELATTTAAIQAIGDGLKTIDPITFDSTQYNALTSVADCASSANKQPLTFTSSNQTVVNNDMMALHKGKTTITATLAESADYYPFVRSAQITVLAINNSYDYSAATCDNEPYSDENFKNLTEAKQYQTTLENRTGGDSLITLTLSIHPTYLFGDDFKVMYVGKDSTWRGKDLSTYPEGEHIVYDSLQTIQGCDSVYMLYLYVLPLPVIEGFVEATVCEGDAYEFKGQFYTKGVYDSIPVPEKNIYGGDSVVTLTVNEFDPVADIYLYDTTYVGDPIEVAGQIYVFQEEGDTTIIDSLTTIHGCDSVIYYEINIKEKGTPTAIDNNRQPCIDNCKFVKDGHLYIRREDVLFDVLGNKVK